MKTSVFAECPLIPIRSVTGKPSGKFLHERMKTFCASGIPRSLIYARSGMEIE